MFLLLAALLLALTTSCAPRPADTQSWPEILAWVHESFPAVPQLGTADLAAQLATAAEIDRPGPVLLDVRTAEEFAVSHLPGARHIPADSDPAA